jgi:hypothetical protein
MMVAQIRIAISGQRSSKKIEKQEPEEAINI